MSGDLDERANGRCRGDDGAATVFVAVLFGALFYLVGVLAYDLPHRMNAIGSATDLAFNSARAGAQQIDVGAGRSGIRRLATGPARAQTVAYLTRAGHPGAVVDVGAETVTVTVTVPVEHLFLPASTVTVTQTARAIGEAP